MCQLPLLAYIMFSLRHASQQQFSHVAWRLIDISTWEEEIIRYIVALQKQQPSSMQFHHFIFTHSTMNLLPFDILIIIYFIDFFLISAGAGATYYVLLTGRDHT